MNESTLSLLLTRQRTYFAQGNTLPVENRLKALRKLQQVLRENETGIFLALQADLGKSESEAYQCELGMVYSELRYFLRHTASLSREQTVPTPLAQFHARSYTKPGPRGVTLILSPWNYPLLLALDPLIAAIAAGNTAIVKPSAYAPATERMLKEIFRQAFPPELAALVTGGREENRQLLEQKFDFIFFTGSQKVGREVLRHAAEHLTPAVLELGGKSPCIVDESANLRLAARRIVFGKFLNCGQTCVAPDYICVHESVAEPLKKALEQEIRRQFGVNPLANRNYGKIINEKHFDRLTSLLKQESVVFGGRCDTGALRIEPTLLAPCGWESPVMQEEIFGPLLPILTYRDLSDLIKTVNARPKPLALYFFSRNPEAIRHVTAACSFGGGCINDTVIHLATSRMGFGGIGESGMGAYHGKAGFEAFSHRKSIVDKKLWLDLPIRYQPYSKTKLALVRKFLR